METVRNTIRDTRRFAAVLSVLIRHGFHGFVHEVGLDGILAKGVHLLRLGSADPEIQKKHWTVRVRLMLEELGPTYIKLGQVLSTRPDLVPQELATELRKLQNDCPKIEFEAIQSQLEREFGPALDTLFATLDHVPLAAGSMAQTHRATLPTGERVVLKILRPDIEPLIASDMNILHEVAAFSEKHLADQGFSPKAVIHEFAKQLKKESDLTHEAKATERLNRMFDDTPEISFPKVYRDQSTRRVLCIEEIQATLLSDLDPATLDATTRRAIVINGTDAVFRMCLEEMFFHADPHPGNIFVYDDGSICFIDCGMTGHINARTADQLARMLRAVLRNDLEATVRNVIELANAPRSLESDREFQGDVSDYIQGFQMIGSMGDARIGELLEGLFDLLRKWKVICPGDLVFLIKAIATIEGVGRQIDPDFDLITHVTPLFKRMAMRRYSVQALRDRMMRAASAYIDLAEQLPFEIRGMVANFKRDSFQISLQHEGLDRLSDTVDRAAKTIGYGLVLAAVIMASSVLVLADPAHDKSGWLALIGILGLALVASFILLLAAINSWKSRRWRPRPRK